MRVRMIAVMGLALGALALAGCAEEKPKGPMERLGEKLDRAADKAAGAADKALDELEKDE
ncbi:MAG: hypothetical protein ACYTGX_16055 [Planctomycetota bacterium]